MIGIFEKLYSGIGIAMSKVFEFVYTTDSQSVCIRILYSLQHSSSKYATCDGK